MRHRPVTSAYLLGGAALLLTGCTSSPNTTTAAPASVTIEASDFSFGDKQYVEPGGLVVLKNVGASVHSLVGLADVTKGSEALVPPGAKVEFSAPTKVGNYVFTCGQHEQMAGVLVVSTTAKPVPTSSFAVHPAP